MPYFHDINPIAFSIGPLAVHWYGIMYLLGFVGAWMLGNSRVKRGPPAGQRRKRSPTSRST